MIDLNRGRYRPEDYEMSEKPSHPVSQCCVGERCGVCRQAATHKVSEVIFDDDPDPHRHPFTSYLCCQHFRLIMGNAAPCKAVPAPLSEE